MLRVFASDTVENTLLHNTREKNRESEEEQRRRKKLEPLELDEELDYQIAKFVWLLQHSLFQDCYTWFLRRGIPEKFLYETKYVFMESLNNVHLFTKDVG